MKKFLAIALTATISFTAGSIVTLSVARNAFAAEDTFDSSAVIQQLSDADMADLIPYMDQEAIQKTSDLLGDSSVNCQAFTATYINVAEDGDEALRSYAADYLE